MSIRTLSAFLAGVCATALVWAVWDRVAPTKQHAGQPVVARPSKTQRKRNNVVRSVPPMAVVDTPGIGTRGVETSEPPASKMSAQHQRQLDQLRGELSKLEHRKLDLAKEQELLNERLRHAERRAGIDQKRHPFENCRVLSPNGLKLTWQKHSGPMKLTGCTTHKVSASSNPGTAASPA